MNWRPSHIRIRLTLWYLAVLALTLSLYAASALGLLYRTLRDDLETALRYDQELIGEHLWLAQPGTPGFSRHLEELEGLSLIEVQSEHGLVLYRSAALGDDSLGGPSNVSAGDIGSTVMRSASGQLFRVRTELHSVAGTTLIVHAGRSELLLREQWRQALSGLLLGLPIALILAGLGGHWLARRALLPIDRMAQQAERMSAENLAERLPVHNPHDELGHLAKVFNAALARIEDSFSELRRFTADASHELRTPLTSLRTVGEVALREPRDLRSYRDAIGSMLEEVDSLAHLVGSLLMLSRAEAGAEPLAAEPLSLLDCAQKSASLLEVLAEEKNQMLLVTGNASARVRGNGDMLKRALVNLIDNAIKYSPEGGCIAVHVQTTDDGFAVVEVRDQGGGISAEHQSKVFERFYRADAGRSRDAGGAGLGLAIAHRVVLLHGGRIELASEPGSGSTFRIVLPELRSS